MAVDIYIMLCLYNITSCHINSGGAVMSPIQKRAWLNIWSMCPVYCLYFMVQFLAPGLLPTMMARIGFLAIVAGFHAVTYVSGLLVFKRQEKGESLLEDERDRGIDARATRVAYFVMLAGMILVGVVMPFGDSGWKIVNAALFFIVLTEGLRSALILMGYRGATRIAH
ncbi:hypothetical protein [Dyella sp. 20L07]|uniref:hypothetical protein n=1 Tax=Dyella sp. 20L07 TaxID=3384240 RepID=UPI003D2B4EBD